MARDSFGANQAAGECSFARLEWDPSAISLAAESSVHKSKLLRGSLSNEEAFWRCAVRI